jgi:hypothetical protein
MTVLSSQPQVATAVLDDENDAPLFLTCPMCHTPTRPGVWWTEHALGGTPRRRKQPSDSA